MKIIECVQSSPEWWEARRGLPTASDFDSIMTPAKQQPSASQQKYIAKLIGDITDLSPTYFSQQGFRNAETDYGQQTEGEARRFYEKEASDKAGRPIKVRQVGFCLHDSGDFGASPDGLIEEEGTLELKCPARKTHYLYLMNGTLPLAYKNQVHGQLIVTGRPWADFMSYCVGERPLIIRVVPDDYTIKLRANLKIFVQKFKEAKERLGIRMPSSGTDEITPEITQAVVSYQERLNELDKEDVDEAMDTVNSWLDEIKAEKQRRPMVALHLWKTVKKYADARQWHFDEVNRMFRKEESVAF